MAVVETRVVQGEGSGRNALFSRETRCSGLCSTDHRPCPMADFLQSSQQEELSKQLEKLDVEAGKEEAENEEDEDDDDEETNDPNVKSSEAAGKKKKKKKKKPAKKKKAAAATDGSSPIVAGVSQGLLPESRLLGGFTDYYVKYGQTYPPTRPVKDLFPSGGFPIGEILPHGKTRYPDPSSSWARQSEEEKR
jgi:F0F1-type ATP synthase assembly protein I